MTIDQQIEAILFWRGEPFTLTDLSRATGASEAEVKTGLQTLEAKLADRGLQLCWKDDEVMLGTRPEASALIEKLTKEELAKDLGKASLETLALVLYKGPITRADIDYIRGVNSSFILRHLAIRGLVEKIADPSDARRLLYRPTFQLLNQLGVAKVEDLPDYGLLVEEINNFAHDHQSL